MKNNLHTCNKNELLRSQNQGPEVVDRGLQGYELTRDRIKRQIKPPCRYAQVDVIAFAFNVE